MTSSGFPPFLSTLKSDWKPTEVKKSIMQISCTVPLKRHSSPKTEYKNRVVREMRRPPETGAGMQNFFRKESFLVKYIPRMRAKTPTPALAYMSSDNTMFFFLQIYTFSLKCLT